MPLMTLGGSSSTPDPPEKLPGALSLGGSVGFNGNNRAQDVTAVQASLNQVMPSFGGATTPLKEDGIAGPKTQNAILRFQTFWVPFRDSKIEPGHKTLFALNRAVGAGAGGATPAGPAAPGVVKAPSGGVGAGIDQAALTVAQVRLARVKSVMLPELFNAVIAAVRLATRASAYAKRLPVPGVAREDPDRLAFLLVAKHFKLHEKNPTQAVEATKQVETVMRRMGITLVNRVGKVIPGVPPGSEIIISLWKTPADVAGHPAYTWYGGFAERHRMLNSFHGGEGATTGFKANFADRIYLTPLFDTSPFDDFRSHVLIHEFAHFTGDMEGGALMIKDLGYCYEAKYLANTPAQRLRNAEPYALLVRECGFGTTRAAFGGQIRVTALGQGPKIFSGSPDPVIPPAPSTGPDPFKFPSGNQ